MIKEGINILYKDLQGSLSLYKVLSKSGKEFQIRQDDKNAREKLKQPKQFKSTLTDKNGRIRLFPLWLEFGENYIYTKFGANREVSLQSYTYNDKELQFDFIEKHTNKLIACSFKDACEFIKFK